MNISVLFDLHGRTALITGGSGVLGSVMASGLAQAGARVAVLGRREEPALAVAATIRAAGGQALGVAADVLDRTALERANETITATFGPVDIPLTALGAINRKRPLDQSALSLRSKWRRSDTSSMRMSPGLSSPCAARFLGVSWRTRAGLHCQRRFDGGFPPLDPYRRL